MRHSESLTLCRDLCAELILYVVGDLFPLTSMSQVLCFKQACVIPCLTFLQVFLFYFVLSVMCNFSCVSAVMCVFNVCEV